MSNHTKVNPDTIRDFVAARVATSDGDPAFTITDLGQALLGVKPNAKARAYLRNEVQKVVEQFPEELDVEKRGRENVYVPQTGDEIDAILDTAKQEVTAMKKAAKKAPTKKKQSTTSTSTTSTYDVHPLGYFEFDMPVDDDGKTPDGVVFAETYFKCPRTGAAILGSRMRNGKTKTHKMPVKGVRKRPATKPPQGAPHWYVWDGSQYVLQDAEEELPATARRDDPEDIQEAHPADLWRAGRAPIDGMTKKQMVTELETDFPDVDFKKSDRKATIKATLEQAREKEYRDRLEGTHQEAATSSDESK